ncbi:MULTISPECIES: hypothetical protein [unclassified Vibrio]|nr:MULTISPECIES: hypothetical protein [unclassified Vibrio]
MNPIQSVSARLNVIPVSHPNSALSFAHVELCFPVIEQGNQRA